MTIPEEEVLRTVELLRCYSVGLKRRGLPDRQIATVAGYKSSYRRAVDVYLIGAPWKVKYRTTRLEGLRKLAAHYGIDPLTVASWRPDPEPSETADEGAHEENATGAGCVDFSPEALTEFSAAAVFEVNLADVALNNSSNPAEAAPHAIWA